jgi:hypothetical protein
MHNIITILFLISCFVLCRSYGSRRPFFFLFVDPLDEHENYSEFQDRCIDNDIEILPIYCSKTSKSLLNSINDPNSLEYQRIMHQTYGYYDSVKEYIKKELSLTHAIDDDFIKNHCLGVICESDTGLRTSELISNELNLLTSNGINENRRDKYLMMNSIDENNRIKQILSSDIEEVKEFIKKLPIKYRYPLIVKPPRGSASVGVLKINNEKELEYKFQKCIEISPGYANLTVSNAVLVQEFIEGDEYVIDTVSCNKEHKICAIWKYDKRQVSDDSPFVYYSTELVYNKTGEINKITEIEDFCFRLLDNLNISFGPCHLEIKYREKPILIEANVNRFHGQNIATIENMCYGYNQVALTRDLYVANSKSPFAKEALENWNNIPSRPYAVARCAARIVHLVSKHELILKNDVSFDNIFKLPTLLRYASMYDGVKGEKIKRTIDLSTNAGYALLVHPNKDDVDKDYFELINLQDDLFK